MTGRPTHKPTKAQRDTVKTLYGAGVDQMNIAAHIGISVKSLRKYYGKELDAGVMEMGVLAIRRLARDMKSPKSGMAGTVASIFVAKNIRGINWADKLDKTGDGPTVQIGSGSKVVILPSNGMEDEVRRRLSARQSQPLMIEQERTPDAVRHDDDEED
jgi:hypothetical protein